MPPVDSPQPATGAALAGRHLARRKNRVVNPAPAPPRTGRRGGKREVEEPPARTVKHNPGLPYQGCPQRTNVKRYEGEPMSKRARKSTQIRVARKDAAARKRAALEFQAPRRQSKPGAKGLSA